MPIDDPDSNDSNEEWERERAEEEADRRRKEEPPPKISEAEFLAWRSPRRGSSNPTRLENPLWNWLVRTRWNAYNANKLYAGPSSSKAGPMWSFERFGMSETVLADGSVVHIGGEHEDHYDPDFFIYNDVIVIDPAGAIKIYAYPQEDFPPTDFHSATRVANAIFIIGRLGYPDSRALDVTPVYKLSLDSMRIEAVEALGDSPGWIYEHVASLSDDGHTLIVSAGERWFGKERASCENLDSWAFNTRNGEWRRLTGRHWQHWIMRRVDHKPNRLWEIRRALWDRAHAHLKFQSSWPYSDEPDFAALDRLYRITEDAPPVIEETGFRAFSVVIDGLTVRFKEDSFWVEAIVEGQLPQERLSELQQSTLALLKRLDCAEYEIQDVVR